MNRRFGRSSSDLKLETEYTKYTIRQKELQEESKPERITWKPALHQQESIDLSYQIGTNKKSVFQRLSIVQIDIFRAPARFSLQARLHLPVQDQMVNIPLAVF